MLGPGTGGTTTPITREEAQAKDVGRACPIKDAQVRPPSCVAGTTNDAVDHGHGAAPARVARGTPAAIRCTRQSGLEGVGA